MTKPEPLTAEEERELRDLFVAGRAGTLGKLTLTSTAVRLLSTLDAERAAREAAEARLEREIAGYLDRLQAAHRMLADCAEHMDMICTCGQEDAGGEVITPDRCWQHRIQAAIRGEYVPHREES